MAISRWEPAHRFRCTFALHAQGHYTILLLGTRRRGAQYKANPFALQGFLQSLCDICVLTREELLFAVDDRHPAAEPAEHLSELQANIPTAENEQVLGHFGQPHNAGVVQVVNLPEPFQVRHSRPGPGVNEDAFAFEQFLPGADLVRADEPGLSPVKVQGLSLLDFSLLSGATGQRPGPCGRRPWTGLR